MGVRRAIVILGFSGVSACTCNKALPPAEPADSGPPVVASSAHVDLDAGGARLSAPIAATHVGKAAVVVAGLVAKENAVRVSRIEADGKTSWSRQVLPGAAWRMGAELRMFPAAEGGVGLVWHGLRDKKTVRELVVLDGAGGVVREPVEIGAAFCATETSFVWTDPAAAGRVRSRSWAAGGDAAFVGSFPSDREPFLVCGAHRPFLLADGDDDRVLVSPDGGAPRTVLSEAEFGEDDQRELAEFTVGDDLGIVRLASSGSFVVRELKDDTLSPLRKIAQKITHDDDLVAVDANGGAIVIVTTHDESDGCPGDAGAPSTRVSGLRVDRKTFAEKNLELSSGACGKEAGPFWTGSLGTKLVVAWVERAPALHETVAPITALVYRVIDENAAVSPFARIEQPADAIVDAGCDAARCYAVALVRAAGDTSMVPEAVKVLRYPE